MSAGLVQAAYIVAAIFFILSLAGLSKQESLAQATTMVSRVWQSR
ncbi:NAD(P) transhydrogenase subunit beta [Vibrio ponticus]|nr:NAD(P) transhydrogenase subunit beta [Vibrio ponticus]